jgi:hypothetical protein
MFQPQLERNFKEEHYNTTHFHRVLRLRISGHVPLFSLYAFMVCIGTTLLIPLPWQHHQLSLVECYNVHVICISKRD